MIVYYDKLYCFRENQPPFTNHSLMSDGYDRGYVSFAHCLLYFFMFFMKMNSDMNKLMCILFMHLSAIILENFKDLA